MAGQVWFRLRASGRECLPVSPWCGTSVARRMPTAQHGRTISLGMSEVSAAASIVAGRQQLGHSYSAPRALVNFYGSSVKANLAVRPESGRPRLYL
jgi:hypothetical protein